MTKFSHLILIASLVSLSACSNQPTLVSGCETVGALEPICQFTNPEDIEALPDRKTLLISQMGVSMEHSNPGSLVFFNTKTRINTPAFPTPVANRSSTTENWGAPQCPGNPGASIAPHGISLRQRIDQRWQVAAVNHGGRESIEMFELVIENEQPRLEWRGCVVPEEGTFMNDVVLMKNGGFIASHMFDKRAPHFLGMSTGVLKAMLGVNTGYVFEWHPGSGFRILEGSHGEFINGVELSADENSVFANVYFGNEVRKLDRASGRKLGASAISKTDNLAWDSWGSLLSVAHTGPVLQQMDCMQHPGETCGLEFTVHRINPATMSSEVVLRHAGAPLGAATVARELDGFLYLGSFSGNRIVKVPYPHP